MHHTNKEKESSINEQDEILYMAFNQDQGCIACGTQSGFRVFNTYPLIQSFQRDLRGGIRIIEMLYRSNIFALVGGGKNAKWDPKKLMIWDDSQSKYVGEITFKSEIQAIKLRPSKVIVVLDNKVYIFNLSDLKLIDYIETCSNPKGLCSLNTEGNQIILATLDQKIGGVTIMFYEESGIKQNLTFSAHQAALSCLELNPKGTKVATASEKGTIIRIYDTSKDNQLLQELRRGTEYAQIYSLCFDYSGQWLACSSDSGTVHIFAMKLSEQEQQEIREQQYLYQNIQKARNPVSKLSFMKIILPYFGSEWSFAQFRVPDTRSKVAFGPEPNTIIVVSHEGKYYMASFDPQNGGECLKYSSIKLFQSEQDNQQFDNF